MDKRDEPGFSRRGSRHSLIASRSRKRMDRPRLPIFFDDEASEDDGEADLWEDGANLWDEDADNDAGDNCCLLAKKAANRHRFSTPAGRKVFFISRKRQEIAVTCSKVIKDKKEEVCEEQVGEQELCPKRRAQKCFQRANLPRVGRCCNLEHLMLYLWYVIRNQHIKNFKNRQPSR